MIHKPVMLREVLEYLAPIEGGVYVDCTFGAGGYTAGILETKGTKVIAVDIDNTVGVIADKFKSKYGNRFEWHNRNYAELGAIIGQKVDGIVIDLGVSSMQLDNANRGFSFNKEAPLDMRMSTSMPISAINVVNDKSEEELSNIIYKYSDERDAKKIAKSIAASRKINKITSTIELANIIENVKRNTQNYKIHPATKTFQAIRIYVNNELESLTTVLQAGLNILKANGRFIIVSFHSGEDKIVKTFLKANSEPKLKKCKYKNSAIDGYDKFKFSLLTKKPITPSIIEVKSNIRSRSAKLRACIKIVDA